ncbi:MAG: D-alanine--D-alanine ligase [Verrucomicrobiales bacterium]|nr:D-alanine--D-alanine ligase [Verrucomicrobiales bacterium]
MLGGPSSEREVSLRSGVAAAAALRSLGHHVQELDPREGSWILPDDTQVVFLALHGSYGEDGTVQQQLEEVGIPYTGCGVDASRLAFDKVASKELFIRDQVPTPRYQVIRSARDPIPAGWAPPLVLKPVRQGSSVGLEFIDEPSQWPVAVGRSLQHDYEILVEERIIGREITIGILDGAVLPIVEICPRLGAFDYHNKYTPGATEYFCPADLSPELSRSIADFSLAAFNALGGRDYGRVDAMVSTEGKPYILEVNTLPGLTGTSLLPKAAAAVGISYAQLCQKMIDLAMRRKTIDIKMPLIA